MRITIWLCALGISLNVVASLALADSLYRCPDGTYTNRLKRNCAPYESKAIGRIHGESIRTDEGKPSVAEIKLYRGSEGDSVRPHPAR
jgi:hypothetical protein